MKIIGLFLISLQNKKITELRLGRGKCFILWRLLFCPGLAVIPKFVGATEFEGAAAPRAPIGSLRPLIFSDQSLLTRLLLTFSAYFYSTNHCLPAYCLLFLLTFSELFQNLDSMASPHPASPMAISNKRRFLYKRKIVNVDPQVRF